MSTSEELRRQLAATQAELESARRQGEEFRQLIGLEIHDGLVQELTAAAMFLEAAEREASHSSPQGRENAERGMASLRRGIAEARRLVSDHAEQSPAVDELLPALETLVERFRVERSLQVAWSRPPAEPRLSPAARWGVLRIVQESLTNVWRHSQTNRVEILMREHAGEMELTIHDSGIGFDPQQPQAGHYGLAGIRQRATLLGGMATVVSTPGQGTTLRVVLPLTE